MPTHEVATIAKTRERAALEELMSSKAYLVPCRRFVYPELTDIRPSSFVSAAEMSISRYLMLLGLGEHQDEIFEKVEDRYTGRFAKDGQQRLADIIGKPIAYAFQENREPCVDTEHALVCHPKLSLE